MNEDTGHWSLQGQAVELWGAGDLVEAQRRFEAAIAACPATHWALGQYRGGYAGVLAARGLLEEAGVQRELALEHELNSGGGDDEPSVAIARYFLGVHRVQEGQFLQALDVVDPSLLAGAKAEPLLRSVQAQALAGLGPIAEAEVAATKAIASARTDEQRSNLAAELAHLLQECG